MADTGTKSRAADPLQDQMEATERLARLIADDDEQRFMLIFQSLANVVDGFLSHKGEESIRHARSVLMRSAEPHLGRAGTAARAAPIAAPTPPTDSIYSDRVFLANARKMIASRDRIVGGVPTADFPDCVAVGSSAGWCCTGTLVAPNVVVTAGHCIAGGCAARVFVGTNVRRPRDGQTIQVKHAEAHPDYRPPNPTHDLAVLILSKEASSTPRGICDQAALRQAFSVRLAGFGNTDVFSSGGYGRRRMVDVPMASANPEFAADPETEFVAGAPFLDRDSCNGDSGGPSYVQVDGEWLLAGATSRATASAIRPCGDGGIYTVVKAYEDWIRSVPGGHW